MGEIALIRKTGFQFGRMHQKGGGWGDPLVQWQCMGALFVFVGMGAVDSAAAFEDGFSGRPGMTIPMWMMRDELLSYRTAVIGLIVGVAYIIAYLLKAGVAPGLLMVTIPAAIVIYIALARFVCESGTLYLGIPTTPLDMGFQLIGTVTIDPRTIAVGSTAHALRWMLFMPALSQNAKVFDRVPGNKRTLFWVLLLGLIGALVVNISMVLYLGYTHGAYNFTEYPFTRYAPRLYDAIVTKIKSPEPASWERMVLFGFGGLIFAILTALRYRLPWWPIHPVGFIITTTSILHEITSLIIVWLFKAIVIRVGGVSLYEKYRPLFFGIIAGRGRRGCSFRLLSI